jgi:hypothetical protein
MANRKNQGLAKRVRAAEVAAGIVAYDNVEAINTTAKTKTDRFAMVRRLRKLESSLGLAATGAARTRNNRLGVENRLRAIEALQ